MTRPARPVFDECLRRGLALLYDVEPSGAEGESGGALLPRLDGSGARYGGGDDDRQEYGDRCPHGLIRACKMPAPAPNEGAEHPLQGYDELAEQFRAER